MPRVTSVRTRRKMLAAIYFDEAWYALGQQHEPDDPLIIDRGLAQELGVAPGTQFTEEALDDLIDSSNLRRAKEKALWLLSGRDYASGELTKRLSRDVPRETALEITERMQELGLLNDEAYAARLARDLMERKSLSRRAAVLEMQLRGIERELAQQAAEDAEIDPISQITRLVEKKYPAWQEDERIKNRMMSALARKGFSGRDIRDALREIIGDDY